MFVPRVLIKLLILYCYLYEMNFSPIAEASISLTSRIFAGSLTVFIYLFMKTKYLDICDWLKFLCILNLIESFLRI